MIKNLYDVAVKGVKVSKKDARKLSKLLESAERAEAELLISKNIGLSKNLKRLIRLKQKIAMLEDNARDLNKRMRWDTLGKVLRGWDEILRLRLRGAALRMTK